MYTVHFKFFDDKLISIAMDDDDLDPFLANIGVNKVYFNKDKSTGIWIHAEQVRYMLINKDEEEDESWQKRKNPSSEAASDSTL